MVSARTINRRIIKSSKEDSVGNGLRVSSSVSFLLTFVFVGLSGMMVYNIVNSINTAYQRNQLLNQAENEVEELRMQNLELQEQLDYVSSAEYVEQEARNQLQYAKDGEIMVLLPDNLSADQNDESGAKRETDNDNTETVSEESSDQTNNDLWQRWLSVLVEGV